MSAPTRPLPKSLTRLLKEPATHIVAPTPGDRPQGRYPHEKSQDGRSQAPDKALELAVLRGFVALVSFCVWGAILRIVLRHFLR